MNTASSTPSVPVDRVIQCAPWFEASAFGRPVYKGYPVYVRDCERSRGYFNYNHVWVLPEALEDILQSHNFQFPDFPIHFHHGLQQVMDAHGDVFGRMETVILNGTEAQGMHLDFGWIEPVS